MRKTLSRLVLGLGLVAAPWMMIGCGEGDKPAATPPPGTEAAPGAAPAPAPAEGAAPAPAPAPTPPAEAPK
jgi:hypothetical protein